MARAKKSESGFVVTKPFRDADEFIVDGVVNRWEVGVDVSHFDEQRLKSLEARGLVKNNGANEESED